MFINLHWHPHYVYISHTLPHTQTLSLTHMQLIHIRPNNSRTRTHTNTQWPLVHNCSGLVVVTGWTIGTIFVESPSLFTDVHLYSCGPKARGTGQRRPADRDTLPLTQTRTRRGPTHHKRKRRRRRKRQQRSNSSTSRQPFDYIFDWTAAGLDVCGCVHGPRRITELRPPRVAPLRRRRRRRHRHLPTSVISQPWSSGGPPLNLFFLREMPITISDCMLFTMFLLFSQCLRHNN